MVGGHQHASPTPAHTTAGCAPRLWPGLQQRPAVHNRPTLSSACGMAAVGQGQQDGGRARGTGMEEACLVAAAQPRDICSQQRSSVVFTSNKSILKPEEVP